MLTFNDLNTVLVVAYLGQGVVGILLFFIFRYFSSVHRRKFLQTWAWGWVFFAVAMVAFIFLTGGMARRPANNLTGMAVSWTSIAFSYSHIFMLMVGMFELLKNQTVSNKSIFRGLIAIAVVSIVLVIVFSSVPHFSADRYLIRVGLRYLIAALSFIIAGSLLLRKGFPGIGSKLLSVSMILYGGMHAYYLAVVLSFVFGAPIPFPSFFGIIDLVLMFSIGLAMVIWLLEDERDRLAKVNKEMDSFFYSTSHDLRAPIASILGLANLAKLELKDETSLKYFEMVENRVKKMDSVISDILQLARSAKTDLKFEEIDFNKLLQEIIADVKFNKGAKAITLRYTPSPAFVLLSDYAQLKIILGNLIANAVKYHFVEQADPFIAVRFVKSDTETLIEVEDNGTGIAKEFQEKIFTMFFRASTQSEGTGLGLYIVSEAVGKLRGKITVSSEVGKGSIFSVRLPVG
jgi:signal transduction histidine kinase